MKKVLIHSLVFNPDRVSTAYLYNDIAIGLYESGFEVVVLTTTPHYNRNSSEIAKHTLTKKLLGIYYTSYFNNIKVYHVPLKKYKNTLKRVFSFVYWHIISLSIGLSIRNIKFVISPSPPLSIGFISLLIAKFKGAKSIYNVQEIYPDLLINQGNLKSSIIIGLLKKLEKFIYNFSDAVTTIDEVFYNTIIERFSDKNKLYLIPNFVDIELYKPLKHKIDIPQVFGEKNNKIKLLYAGNIGFFQDWDPVFYAANQLKNENIEFWIIGEGVQKKEIEERIKNENMENIRLFPYLDREYMPIINNYVDIHFICINPRMEQEGFPSKVYTIMACAKPLIVVTGITTPLHNFLKKMSCSILISENRNVNFTNAIRELAFDKNLRETLGYNGYLNIVNKYSKKAVVSKYINLLNSL